MNWLSADPVSVSDIFAAPRRCIRPKADDVWDSANSFLRCPCPAPGGSGQFFGLASASRGVQSHCVADESLEGGVVHFFAFVQVDGTPDVAVKAGVEELRRIPQLSTLGECQLDHVLVCLPRANQPVVRPHRNASPFPLFGNLRAGFFDQGADPGERLAAPVAQLLDPRVYQPRW